MDRCRYGALAGGDQLSLPDPFAHLNDWRGGSPQVLLQGEIQPFGHRKAADGAGITQFLMARRVNAAP
ncbi:hypothetical protein Q666_15625 [Marinobacter sp. ES-1]|nr:hypothetical protein Q666_15625 [Marinobacter sp. ES-1]